MVIGEKIKDLRLSCELTQEELADRCELTKGYISQLENDLTSPSITTLVDILSALGTDLKTFFNDEVQDKIVFSESDFIEKVSEESTLNWLVPNAQKNVMEPVHVTLEPNSSTDEDYPHEGEEFVYVMEGAIEVCHGKNKYVIEAGDTIYYDSIVPHHLHGYNGQAAKILAVVYTPI